MTQRTTAAITAVNAFLPEDKLTNADLEGMVETTNDWIIERTGVQERRILRGKDKGNSTMAAEAVRGLLAKRGITPEEVELLICCTVTPDHQFPSTANIVSHKVGIKNAWSFDLNAACSSFIYGLTVGSQFIETGKYTKVVVVGSDKMSSIIDYTDRTTCVLFGDGAAAVLLEPNTEGLGVVDSVLHSDGSGMPFLHQKAGGSVHQEGKTVFKFAVTNMADVSATIMERNGLRSEDVAWLVPHQANKRIIDATAQRMGLDDSRVMLNIHKYGNTTSGTIPLCLWEWENRLHKGDNLVLAAFGGGFTWGAILLRWAYDPK
jgi:3-oxoacyl-[acyl-carrier-protein] synthase III